MIVYHADTFGRLREGQMLTLHPARTPIGQLYPCGVSSYGERAFLKPCNPEQATMQAIDILFDYVRCMQFPNKPSRFTSVYASASLEESKAWSERIVRDFDRDTGGLPVPSNCGISIYAVEPSMLYIADAHFLDCGSALRGSQPALSNILPYALEYWRSVREIHNVQMLSAGQNYQKLELLLVPPVRVVEKVYP